MNKNIALCALLGALVFSPSAHAEETINLSEYKTVAVQPVIAASNTRGLFESHMAAQASLITIGPEAAKQVNAYANAREDSGFGFAGKAKQSDVVMLYVGSALGMMPTLIKINPDKVKETVAKLEILVAKLEGKVSIDVIVVLKVALIAAASGDLQSATKATISALGVAAESISKGSERAHGYMATGLYTGLATLWAAGGVTNVALADLAAPLVMLLEEDAAMGGADRKVAAELKKVAALLRTPSPDLSAIMSAATAMSAVKPD